MKTRYKESVLIKRCPNYLKDKPDKDEIGGYTARGTAYFFGYNYKKKVITEEGIVTIIEAYKVARSLALELDKKYKGEHIRIDWAVIDNSEKTRSNTNRS